MTPDLANVIGGQVVVPAGELAQDINATAVENQKELARWWHLNASARQHAFTYDANATATFVRWGKAWASVTCTPFTDDLGNEWWTITSGWLS